MPPYTHMCTSEILGGPWMAYLFEHVRYDILTLVHTCITGRTTHAFIPKLPFRMGFYLF